ncbi:MAG: YcxB family protein [Lacrimispora celerecrescens]|nr:YcxB family protein [Lacrimispora celerecrescens]
MEQSFDPKIIMHVAISKEQFCSFSNFQAFRLHHRFLSLIAFAALLFLFGWFQLITGSQVLCAVFARIGFLFPAVYLYQYKNSVKAQIQKLHLEDNPYEAYTIHLNHSGISADTKKEHSSYDWKDLSAAHKVGDCTFLYYTQKRAFILPDNCITKGTKEELWQLLCSNMPKHSVKKWRRQL